LAAQSPKMFLYDEPTSDLDPLSAAKIRSLIMELDGKQRGFIIVTHEMRDALKLGNRFLFLKNGKICFDGNRDELINTKIPELMEFLKNS
ncbi:MAG: peptide ABC transporter ATP-binding protein, partial [Fibrobacter sp.]|nr:peptide ABC transporter ATP-binding protein [Fibrobacter sp.]